MTTAVTSAPRSAGSSAVVSAVRQNKVGTGLTAALALVLVAAAGYGIYAFLTRSRPAPFQNINVTKITDTGDAVLAAISPDGKYILSLTRKNGLASLWLQECAHQQQYTGPAASRCLLQRAALFAGRQLFLFRAQRSRQCGAEISLSRAAAGRHAAEAEQRRGFEHYVFSRWARACVHALRQSGAGQVPVDYSTRGRRRGKGAGHRSNQRLSERAGVVTGRKDHRLRHD